MKIDEMLDRKKELGYTLRQIADKSGVPLGTVQKIFSGHTKAPRYETLRALEAVLQPPRPIPDPAKAGLMDGSGWASSMVREKAFAYQEASRAASAPADDRTGEQGLDRGVGEGSSGSGVAGEKKQGEYTLEDYCALPEERRVELIDGVIYDMTAPTTAHQIISQHLFVEIWNFVRGKKGRCVVNIAPTDVHIDPADNRTMVQPDVLVTCDRDKITLPRVEGAPDMIIEVLSPSTRRKDISIKVNKYAQTGVRELWLVDPRDRRIIVYDFEHEDTIRIYTFQDKVPVQIFAGDLQIDFDEITEYLTDLLGEEWYER